MQNPTFTVRVAVWPQDRGALAAVRHAVFVAEQHVDEHEEWDGLDASCHHVLAEDAQGRAIGVGRLTRAGQIGRVAVLPAWRGRRVGTALMRELLAIVRREGYEHCYLHAQLSAVAFYVRLGFAAYGDTFVEADIRHQAMYLEQALPLPLWPDMQV